MVLLLLGGCSSELYTGLSEKEANAMLALLQKHEITVSKKVGKGGQVTIFVRNSKQADAIDILNRFGYPKAHFDSVPSLFPQDSLIKSPLEEQARFAYAKSQELAKTLSEIDGVLSARVHLVLPQQESRRGRAESMVTPTASVFIKHNTNIDVSGYTPQIKLLISKAVPSLSYDNISIAFFPSEISAEPLSGSHWTEFLFIKVAKESQGTFIVLVLILLLLALGGPAGIYFWYRYKENNQEKLKEDESQVTPDG